MDFLLNNDEFPLVDSVVTMMMLFDRNRGRGVSSAAVIFAATPPRDIRSHATMHPRPDYEEIVCSTHHNVIPAERLCCDAVDEGFVRIYRQQHLFVSTHVTPHHQRLPLPQVRSLRDCLWLTGAHAHPARAGASGGRFEVAGPDSHSGKPQHFMYRASLFNRKPSLFNTKARLLQYKITRFSTQVHNRSPSTA